MDARHTIDGSTASEIRARRMFEQWLSQWTMDYLICRSLQRRVGQKESAVRFTAGRTGLHRPSHTMLEG